MKVTRFDQLGDVRLRATAHHLPEQVVTTEELFPDQPELAKELVRLTGIERRHFVRGDEATSDLALRAARPLLEHGPVDRLLCATMSPDHPSPATAPLLQHKLGLPPVPSMDVVAACSGYVFALDAAARAVLTGDESVLVVAAEARSRQLRSAAPGVRCLFGDGAASALVRRGGTGWRLMATGLASDGSGYDAVRVEAGGSRLPTSHETVSAGLHALRMQDGPMVFFQAVEGFVSLAESFLKALGIGVDQVDLIVPHQANLRILERVARLLRIPLHDKLFSIVDAVGNVGGASVGIALDRARAAGRAKPGGRVLLLTAGAGFTAGAALLEVSE